MGITEIVLIIIGILVFAASFLLPERLSEKDSGNLKEQERKLKAFLQRELQNIRMGIEEKVDESMVASTEKTERYMERITNEKIMAIQEYSDTVLEQIHKNHEEAVFLYDMLNNKHDQIKYTAGEISSTVDGAREKLELTVQDTARELLKGSIRENLLEKIQNMLEETVQEAIDLSVKDTLQEKIDYEIQEGIRELVSTNLTDIVKEAVEKVVRESDLSSMAMGTGISPAMAGAAVMAADQPVSVQEPVPVQSSVLVQEAESDRNPLPFQEPEEPIPDLPVEEEEELPENTSTDGTGSGFKGFSFDPPEVIMEEEQPLVVQSVKRAAPKKKTPGKKNPPRTLSTLGGQVENEIHAYSEPARHRKNNKETILQMHKEGMSNVAIAKELGMGIGEVQLIIGLFE